jgi:hypothetical protein
LGESADAQSEAQDAVRPAPSGQGCSQRSHPASLTARNAASLPLKETTGAPAEALVQNASARRTSKDACSSRIATN